jgi:hypothetical protein
VTHRTLIVVAALCLALAQAAGPSRADAAARARASVTLEVKNRIGWEHQWKFNVLVRVRARGSGKPLPNLRVVVSGAMSVPGHSMRAAPIRFRHQGAGIYRGAIAFYMRGEWRLLVSVQGSNVVPAVTRFNVVVDQ